MNSKRTKFYGEMWEGRPTLRKNKARDGQGTSDEIAGRNFARDGTAENQMGDKDDVSGGPILKREHAILKTADYRKTLV